MEKCTDKTKLICSFLSPELQIIVCYLSLEFQRFHNEKKGQKKSVDE